MKRYMFFTLLAATLLLGCGEEAEPEGATPSSADKAVELLEEDRERGQAQSMSLGIMAETFGEIRDDIKGMREEGRDGVAILKTAIDESTEKTATKTKEVVAEDRAEALSALVSVLERRGQLLSDPSPAATSAGPPASGGVAGGAVGTPPGLVVTHEAVSQQRIAYLEQQKAAALDAETKRIRAEIDRDNALREKLGGPKIEELQKRVDRLHRSLSEHGQNSARQHLEIKEYFEEALKGHTATQAEVRSVGSLVTGGFASTQRAIRSQHSATRRSFDTVLVKRLAEWEVNFEVDQDVEVRIYYTPPPPGVPCERVFIPNVGCMADVYGPCPQPVGPPILDVYPCR